MGKPSNEGAFNHFKIGDINVYVANRLKVSNKGLKISLSKLLWIKSLNVDGVVL